MTYGSLLFLIFKMKNQVIGFKIERCVSLLYRYAPSASARHVANQNHEDHELKENLEKYPSKCDDLHHVQTESTNKHTYHTSL